MRHPLYSSRPRVDCYPSFQRLKKYMAVKRCTTDINVKQTVTPWLQTLDNGFRLHQDTSLDVTVRQMLKFPW